MNTFVYMHITPNTILTHLRLSVYIVYMIKPSGWLGILVYI